MLALREPFALREPLLAEHALRGFLFDPLAPLRAMDRLMDGPAPWGPAVDRIETDDASELVADVPGLGPGDVEVEAKDSWITLRGRRAAEGWVRTFQRSFFLGTGYALDAASATLEHGVLRVRVPKETERAPKPIPIHAAPPAEPPGPGGGPGLFERAKRAILDLVRRDAN
jgi:HSP20 family protein